MQSVSERLAARGVEVSVIATTARSTEDYFLPGRGKNLLPAGSEKIGGVSVERVPFTRSGARLLNAARALAVRVPFLPGGNRLRMKSWGPRSSAYERALAAHGEADVFAAAPLPTMNVFYAWRAARKNGRPFVVVPCFHTEDAYAFHNPLHYRMLRDADAVIALSETEKEFLCREARLDPERVRVLGAGIDLDAREPAVDVRAKYGIRQDRVVLFLGQHGAHKGILDLLAGHAGRLERAARTRPSSSPEIRPPTRPRSRGRSPTSRTRSAGGSISSRACPRPRSGLSTGPPTSSSRSRRSSRSGSSTSRPGGRSFR